MGLIGSGWCIRRKEEGKGSGFFCCRSLAFPEQL